MEEKENKTTASEPQSCPTHRSKIGGQALIEGVMMKGVSKGAMACRLPDGTIDVETWDIKGGIGKERPWYKKTPLVRGVYSFIFSMVDGYKCLMKSAEKQMTEDGSEAENENEKPSKLDLWLEAHFTEKTVNTIMTVFTVLSTVAALLLFLFLPKWIVGGIMGLAGLENRILQSFLEGIVKIIIFIGYMAVTGLSKDIRRTYEYHGAEHKTIACFEAGLPLTVENVQKQVRLHPRCGTSFIFLTLFISILVMCLVPFTIPWQRFLCSFALLPITVGCSFEAIQFAGRSSSFLSRFISWPGLQLQRITTREPDASQIECAIAALTPCIPENLEDDRW
ncbi:MAG: DUF1385 domain-containing protein [Oscillospiraceae bacterium]|nr:DUF1385 domain-containing protein [Oscillospiraceae bacterium]